MLEELGGDMAQRAADVRDVRGRIVAELRGEQPPGIPEVEEAKAAFAGKDAAPKSERRSASDAKKEAASDTKKK